MAPSGKRTGIVQVAKLAGVSPMTVTRTLNASAPVAEATRKRVLEATEKLGYKANPFARALRGCKTKSVGIVWGLGGPHSSVGIVRDMSWELHKQGYVTYINDSLSDPEAIRKILREYVDRRVDGLIISVHFMCLLEDKQIQKLLRQLPAVVIESPENHDLPYDKLILDYYRSMEDIVDHFAKTGRKRPAAVTDAVSVQPRIKVFKRRLEHHGIDTKDFFIDIVREGVPLGRWFVDGLVRRYPDGKYPFDAVWTSCDEGAAALMAHFIERGYRIPEDIAVVGFNNNETSQYLTPPLASVERMNGQVMSAMVSMLLNRMAAPRSKLKEETVYMEFVPRKSAG